MVRLFFEDITSDQVFEFKSYHVDGNEMLEFNQRWDRLPIHIDQNAAKLRGHQGIIASGQYTLCIKQHFINQCKWRESVIGAAGWETVRFHSPVYAEDDISAKIRCIEKIESRSKPDRGIVKLEILLLNQNHSIVLSMIDNVMIEKRLKSR